jgi:hypothetical protein
VATSWAGYNAANASLAPGATAAQRAAAATEMAVADQAQRMAERRGYRPCTDSPQNAMSMIYAITFVMIRYYLLLTTCYLLLTT